MKNYREDFTGLSTYSHLLQKRTLENLASSNALSSEELNTLENILKKLNTHMSEYDVRAKVFELECLSAVLEHALISMEDKDLKTLHDGVYLRMFTECLQQKLKELFTMVEERALLMG